MSYNPTNWTNEPSTATPINATNLNKLEQGVKNATQKAESADNVINNGRLSTSGLQTELANIAAGLHPEAVSDVFIAGKIADPASQTNAELSAKYVAVAEKGSPSGIATLDSTTKVPVTQLPLGAIADSPELSATIGNVSGPLILAASPLIPRPKLKKFYAALAGRASAPCQILAGPGDSITEGAYASTLSMRWQTRLQANLRARLGAPQGAIYPYLPAGYVLTQPAVGTHPAILTGVGLGALSGLGMRSGQLSTAGHYATFVFKGSSARVHYQSQVEDATGVMSIVVDGGAPILVDTAPPGGAANSAAFYNLGPWAEGSQHTVVVGWHSSSPAGKSVYLQGLSVWDGDETQGIRVIDGARSGATTASFNIATANAPQHTLNAAGGASLMITALGTNDIATGISAAAFKTNYAARIAQHRAVGFAGSILYMLANKPGDKSEAEWAPYRTAMQELAAADADGDFLDLGTLMPNPASDEPAAGSMDLYQDFRHLRDRGNGWVADAITGFLLGTR